VLTDDAVPAAKDLGAAPVNISYGSGAISGALQSASVELGGLALADQQFLSVKRADSTTNVSGILGVAPPILSEIWTRQRGAPAAAPALQRLFTANTSAPAFTTSGV
jgi:hypothetical protein